MPAFPPFRFALFLAVLKIQTAFSADHIPAAAQDTGAVGHSADVMDEAKLFEGLKKLRVVRDSVKFGISTKRPVLFRQQMDIGKIGLTHVKHPSFGAIIPHTD